MQYWNILKNLIFIKKTGIPHFLKFERILLSGLIFYIILATYAVSALPSNLISNPGFELGTIQPLNWNLVNSGANTVTWDTDSHTGTRSIQINNPGTTDSWSGYVESDLIPAFPLQDYTLSAWVKTLGAGGSSEPAVRVVELDSNKNWIRQSTLYFNQGTNDWTNKQTNFQTDINTKYLYVYANIWSGYGTFWVDDVLLTSSTSDATAPVINTVTLDTSTPNTGDPILVTVDVTDNIAVTGVEVNGISLTHQSGDIWSGAITAIEGTHSVYVSATDASGNIALDSSQSYTATSPPSGNLISNPGFELGTIQPLNWHFVNNGVNTVTWDDTVSHTGTKSIKINTPGTANTLSGYAESDLIPAIPLKYYTFTGWGKTLNVYGISQPAIRVKQLDANFNFIKQSTLYFNHGTNDWSMRTLESYYGVPTVQATSNTKYFQVYAIVWYGYGTFWVDDVVLKVATP